MVNTVDSTQLSVKLPPSHFPLPGFKLIILKLRSAAGTGPLSQRSRPGGHQRSKAVRYVLFSQHGCFLKKKLTESPAFKSGAIARDVWNVCLFTKNRKACQPPSPPPPPCHRPLPQQGPVGLQALHPSHPRSGAPSLRSDPQAPDLGSQYLCRVPGQGQKPVKVQPAWPGAAQFPPGTGRRQLHDGDCPCSL